MSKAKLIKAAQAVLADHDERIRLYPNDEGQPNRVYVMENLRLALEGMAPKTGGVYQNHPPAGTADR